VGTDSNPGEETHTQSEGGGKRPFLGEALASIGPSLAQQYEVPQIVPERLASLLNELARYDGAGE
jgi:hypothetical protein